MSNKIVLCNCDQLHDTVKDIKFEWCMQVLETCGVSIEEMNLNDIMSIKNILYTNSLDVVYKQDGSIDIHKVGLIKDRNGDMINDIPSEQNLIAQWKEPKYIKKINNKEAYYEIHLNEWSIHNIRK